MAVVVVERRCDHELSNADEHDAMTKSAARADQRCRRLMSPLVVAAARPMGSTRTAGAHGQRVVIMRAAARRWISLDCTVRLLGC